MASVSVYFGSFARRFKPLDDAQRADRDRAPGEALCKRRRRE
jgi:hypothetical protein